MEQKKAVNGIMNSNKRPLKNDNNTIFFTASITMLVILAFSLISGILPLPNYAYAHSLPVTETPAPNSIIKKGEPSPSKIIIDFSERPDPNVSTMQVLDSKNQRVDNNDFTIIGDHDREAMTTLDTHKLTDGVYTVSWMTQSADDGHIARGSYVFGIGNVGPPGSATGSAASIINGKVNNMQRQQQTQVQEITSTLDGIIKWPLLVSQVTIVGGIFSHLFLWEKFGSKIGRRSSTTSNDNTKDKANLQWLRTFSIILVAAAIVIIATGSLLLFLQITELSANNNISSYTTIFKSLLMGSSGKGWLIRSIASLIIIAASTSYYHLLKKRINKMTISSNLWGQHQQQYDLEKVERTSKKSTSNQITIASSSSSLLYISLIAGAVCIFSNSMTSHNAGVKSLPSLAVLLDWLHFMAVSMWIGGLFYISTVLLNTIRANTTISKTAAAIATMPPKILKKTISNKEKGTTTPPSMTYYLTLLLPRFSLIATISLGVIGVSGLYMAWIQLHSINTLFDTPYGNTLIIKLSAILPLVLLGAYHQLILHRNVVLAANLGEEREKGKVGSTNTSDDGTRIAQSFSNTDNNNSSKKEEKISDIFSKFSKTIKVESLLAIGVLLAASLLTITSPPAMNMPSMSMMSSPTNSHSSMSSMSGMSTMMPIKNSTYVNQVKIMNVNTKIEINPFYVGFNTFKISFTDTKGKPVPNISGVELIFTNNKADIGPITANLEKTSPGVYSNTGAYISQPGEWDIAMAAQRTGDYDLNYKFTSKVNNAPPSSSLPTPIPLSQAGSSNGNTGTAMSTQSNNNNIKTENINSANNNSNNNMEEPMPPLDYFAWLMIGLSAAIVFGSAYYYKRSKQDLRKTIEMLDTL